MAYDGSGNYSLPPGSIVSDGTTIDAADHNVPVTDLAAAMSQVLLRSGVAPMTGDLDLGGNDVINAGGSGGTYLTTANTGTSGHTIPYLDQANTWTTVQTFNASINAIGGGVLGDAAADVVMIKGVFVSTYGSAVLASSNGADLRAYIGLGTAATQNTGTSGATVPLLNGSNTWSGSQAISVAGGAVNLGLTHPSSTTIPALYMELTGGDAFTVPQAWFLGNGVVLGAINTTMALGGGSTEFKTTSDERMKRAMTPLIDSGTIIDQLAPIRFRWMRNDGPEDFGFSAQALHAVVPQAVTPGTGEPGQPGFVPWMREHGRLEAILVAEIKALRARVAALEAALP